MWRDVVTALCLKGSGLLFLSPIAEGVAQERPASTWLMGLWRYPVTRRLQHGLIGLNDHGVRDKDIAHLRHPR